MFQPRCYRIERPECGLLAFIVIDDTSLGPSAGGIRTQRYASEEAARADAHALARAMTYKCALAGLPAGGGKGVVMLHEGLEREQAFELLGEHVDSLGGRFLTAGDMGTTADDLRAMARRTRHVYTDESDLARAVGLGCLRAIQACVEVGGGNADDLQGIRIAVQGCGTVGAAVARQARAAGADVLVADIDEDRAGELAADIDAGVIAVDEVLTVEAEVLAPCARGGVITPAVAKSLRVGAVCGAANNILSSADAEDALADAGVTWVPDALSSAGAVVLGVGHRVIGLDDCGPLIDRIFDTTRSVLIAARDSGERAGEIARRLAEARILAARGGV